MESDAIHMDPWPWLDTYYTIMTYTHDDRGVRSQCRMVTCLLIARPAYRSGHLEEGLKARCRSREVTENNAPNSNQGLRALLA